MDAIEAGTFWNFAEFFYGLFGTLIVRTGWSRRKIRLINNDIFDGFLTPHVVLFVLKYTVQKMV